MKEPRLESPHRGLFGGFGVVPAADVEGAVGRQEAQFVRRGPSHVACLATVAGLGLLGGALDGDHDVAEVRPAAGREWEVGLGDSGRGTQSCSGKASGASNGNDSTSVGPVFPRCAALSTASSASSDRINPSEAGPGAPAAVSAAAVARASAAPAIGKST